MGSTLDQGIAPVTVVLYTLALAVGVIILLIGGLILFFSCMTLVIVPTLIGLIVTSASP